MRRNYLKIILLALSLIGLSVSEIKASGSVNVTSFADLQTQFGLANTTGSPSTIVVTAAITVNTDFNMTSATYPVAITIGTASSPITVTAGTLTIGTNVTITETITNAITVNSGGNLVVNSGASITDNTNPSIYATGGTVIVNGGSVTTTGTSNPKTIWITGGSTCFVNGGTIQNTSSTGPNVIFIDETVAGGGKLYITGGTIQATKNTNASYGAIGIASTSSGQVWISGSPTISGNTGSSIVATKSTNRINIATTTATFTGNINTSGSAVINNFANTSAIAVDISGGTYPSTQTVTLSGGTNLITQYTSSFNDTYTNLKAGGSSVTTALKYTTDGTDPTSSSTTYSTPLTISTTTKLKVASWISGTSIGVVSTFNYNIPPLWTSTYPAIDLQTTSGFRAKVNINEPGKSYFVVLGSGATAPSTTQVKSGQDATGTSLASNLTGTITCSALNTEYTSTISGLTTHPIDTNYDVYFVAEDVNSTLQASVTKVTTSTLALSSVADPVSVNSAVISQTQINLSFTPNASNNNVLIAYNSSNTFGTPTNGASYSFGNTLSGGGTIIYNGGTSPYNHTSLTPNTAYYYKVWSVDGSNNYSTGLFANNTTLAAEPTIQASSIVFSAVSPTGMTISWTGGNGSNRIVLVKAGSAVDSNPVDGTTYTANTAFGSGTQIGSGNYVVYNSTGSSVTITGASATVYYVAVYEFNGTTNTHNYLTSSSATGSQTTYGTVPSAPTALTFSSVTSNSFKASFAAPGTAPTGYLVLRKTNNAVVSTPVIGTTYTQGSTFGSDDVVYVGTSAWNGYDQTGLADNITYSYAIYSYNGTGLATNYSASALINVGITNEIATPTANSATNTSSNGFTANWASVSGATSYKLDINTSSNFPFEESFERCKLGSETAACSGANYSLAANVDNFMHSTGWTSWFTYQAGGNLYLGFGANASAITTPKMDLTGTYTLTFDCKTYIGSTATTYGVWLSTDNGATFTQQVGTDLTSQATWTSVTFTIVGGNANSKIKIVKAGDVKLILIRNIRIFQTDNLSGYNNLSVSGTTQAVTGLSPNTTYYYRVRAVDANGASLNSSTITASTTGITNTVSTTNLPDCPTCNITVVSGGELDVDNTKAFNSITVEPGGKLTNTGSLSLATLNLHSDGSGTGTYVDKGTTSITTANVQQYLPQGRNWYVSSPIAVAGYSVLNTGTSVVRYNETTGLWDTETGTLAPMRGYISVSASGTGTSNVNFSGILNTGNQTTDVAGQPTLTRTGTATKPGFNLVGNPYPSYVNWTAATKTNIESTYWFRTKTAPDPDLHTTTYVFDTYNASGGQHTSLGATAVSNLIPPMQAFWVRVVAGQTSGTLAFTNEMRAHTDASGNTMKAPSAVTSEQKVLRLQVSNDSNKDEAVIYFDSNASNAYDAYDSPKMSNVNAAIPEIFTVAGSEQVVINGLNSIASDEELPLGFTTGQSNTFSIKATELSNFETGTNILLRDKVLNTEQDITDGSAYTFTSDATTANTSRFSLIFKSGVNMTGLNELDNNLNVSVSRNANNQITVNCFSALNEQSTITVYNALGQALLSKQLKNTVTVIDNQLTSGVYLVSVKSSGKSCTKKVILN